MVGLFKKRESVILAKVLYIKNSKLFPTIVDLFASFLEVSILKLKWERREIDKG